MKVGKYYVQPTAPFRNVWLFLSASPHRAPFLMDSTKFETYPQPERYYVVEQDGIGGQWFAHDNNFINVIESNASFADSPQAALMDYMHEYADKDNQKEEGDVTRN